MENPTASTSDIYVSVSRLLYQLAHGKVNLQRLPNNYLQKSLSTKYNASNVNNYEENKENNTNSQQTQNKHGNEIIYNNYRTIKCKQGGVKKELLSGYCQSCDKTFTDLQGNDPKCKICERKFSSYTCVKCSWTYISLSSLKTHLYKVCNPLTYFICCECDYRSYKATDMELHVLKHKSHSRFGGPESKLQDDILRCDLCPYTASLKYCLLIHLRAKHPETIAEPLKEESSKKCECLKCGRVFVNETGLRNHRIFCQKSPKIKCPVCSHKVYLPKMMKTHIKNMHREYMKDESNKDNERRKRNEDKKKKLKANPDDLPYIVERMKINSKIMVNRYCKDCKKPYNKSGSYTICRSCKGVLQYDCRKCGNVYPTYNKVKNHVRYACFGKTVYYCKQCNCKRTAKEYILRHIRKAHGKSVT